MHRSSYKNALCRLQAGLARPSPSTKSLGCTWRPYPSKYLYFDGVDDRVDLPNTGVIFGASQDITVELWLDPYSATDWQRIFCQAPVSSDDLTIAFVNDGVIALGNGGTNRGIGAKHSTTDWFHLAVTREGSVYHIFKNGLLTTSDSTNTAGVGDRNTLGCRYRSSLSSYANFYNGKMWNFRIWSRALSQAEIAVWMNMDPKPNRSDLLMWLPMDEGSGTSLSDVTGNGWNGSITGCTWV